MLPVVFFRPSCSAFLCFHFFLFWIPEGGGEGGSERGHRRRQKERERGKGLERGREQTREIGEIGRGRETERGEGQGRDKEGRERQVVKGLTSTTGFHSLEPGGLDLTNRNT